jgi:hypothetical protein
VCAVSRCRSSVGAIPTWQLSLQPVAIGAAMEVTISPKLSMERAGKRPREQAGRNMRERRAGLETINVGADPALTRGRPKPQASGERNDPALRSHRGKGDGMSVEEIGRNTGDPLRWARDPTGRPRGTGQAVGGVGEVRSTVEAG